MHVVEGNGVSNEGHGYLGTWVPQMERWWSRVRACRCPGCRQGTIFVWWTSLMVEREKVGIDKRDSEGLRTLLRIEASSSTVIKSGM